MSVEAQEVAVRVRLLGGTAFETEAAGVSESIRGIGRAGKAMNAEMGAQAAANGGLLGFLGRAGGALDGLHGKLTKFSKKATEVGRQTAMLSVGAGLLIYGSVKERTESEAYFTRLETQAGATHKQREALEKAAPQFAKYGMSITEVSKALYPLQSDLKNTTKDIDLLKAAGEGAAVGMGSPEQAATVLTSAYQAHFKDIKSPLEIMNLMLRTSGESKAPFESIVSAFSTTLMPTVKSMGMPMRDTLAALAGMSRLGNEPDAMATLLRTALIKAQTLKGQALDAAKKLGINSAAEATLMMEKPGGIVNLLERVQRGILAKGPTGTKGNAEAKGWAAEMFGMSRSYGTVAALLASLGYDKEILKNLGLVKGGHRENDELFGKTDKTLRQQFKNLKAEAHDFLNELGAAFGPEALGGAKLLVGTLHEITVGFAGLPAPAKDVIGGVVGLTAVLSPLGFLIGGLTKGTQLALTPLKGVIRLIKYMADESALIPSTDLRVATQAEKTAGALGKVTSGFKILASTIGVGGVLYLALEAANRAAGGKHWIGQEVFDKGKQLGHDVASWTKANNPFRGAASPLSGPEEAVGNLISLFGGGHKAKPHYVGIKPFRAGSPEMRMIERLEAAERAEHKAQVKVDLHVEGKPFGEAVLRHTPPKLLAKTVNKANKEHTTRN